jgi:hypothetical protein
MGKLFLSKTDRTIVGWLVDSWSENGSPYWQPKMHWLDETKDKLCHFEFPLKMRTEDTSIDPERAKFIRETVSKWKEEWLAQEAKK